MSLVEDTIEKLKQMMTTSQFEDLSIIGKAEIEDIHFQLRDGLRLEEKMQRSFVERILATDTFDPDAKAILQSTLQFVLNPPLSKIDIEKRLMDNIQQAPNLEALATVLEEYPYEMHDTDKDQLIIALKALSKDEGQIQAIATQGYRAFEKNTQIPLSYGIQDQVIALARKYASVPKPPPLPPLPKKTTVKLKASKEIPKQQSLPLSAPDKNQPEFTSLHPKIKSPSREMYIGSSGREASLVSLATYKKLRTLQIKSLMEKGNKRQALKSRFYTPKSHPDLGLKYPVFFGDNGELIAIMREAPSDKRFRLGEGAFGEVFLGMNIDTGKMVAVKVQNPSLKFPKSQLAAKKEEIREEMGTMQNVDRLISSIEQGEEIISVDELAGTASYISLLEGSNERSPLRGNNSDEALAFKMKMALEFLTRVEELHTGKSSEVMEKEGSSVEPNRKKYIHGDIKVDNTMFGNGKAKLIDFGFALEVPPPPQQFTYFYSDEAKKTPVRFKGTPIYMSPEIVKDGAFSIQSDVYACAVALIEIFSARDIFNHTILGQEWSGIALQCISNNDFRPLAEFLKGAAPDILNNPYLPAPLKPIVSQITQMLSHNIDERPPLTEVIQTLKTQKEILEYNVFVIKLINQDQTTLSLSEEDIKNPYIKEYIFALYRDKDPRLQFINRESVFGVLQAAAKEDDVEVFRNAAKHFLVKDKHGEMHSLYALQSQPYIDDLAIIIKENQSKEVEAVLNAGLVTEDARVHSQVEQAKSLEELISVMQQIPSMTKATQLLKRMIQDPDKLQRIAKGEQLFPLPQEYNVPQKLRFLANEAFVKQNKIEASKKQRLDTFLSANLRESFQENVGSKKGLWLVNKTRKLGEKVFSKEASLNHQLQKLNDIMTQIANSDLSTDQKGHLAYAILNLVANRTEEGSSLQKICSQRLNDLNEMNSKYAQSLPPISDPGLNRVVYNIMNEANNVTEKVSEKPKLPKKGAPRHRGLS